MKILLRFNVFSLILLILFIWVPKPVLATDKIKIFIDRAELNNSLSPVIINGHSMVPMRSIFEALGAQVIWDNKLGQITATKEKTTIKLTIGSDKADKNGQTISLAAPVQIIDSRTYVPLRFVSEALDYHVYWNGKTNGVFISTKGEDSELAKQEVFSQIKTWRATIDGGKGDHASCIQQTNDGGYIVLGDTRSFQEQNQADVYLIKLDSFGNKQWEKTFGGTDDDIGCTVQQTKDNGFIISECSSPVGSTASKALLIKTDENGNQQWEKELSKYIDGNADVFCAKQTKDNGYIAVGTKQNKNEDDKAWMVKLDETANVQWEITSNNEDLVLKSVIEDDNGNYIATGYFLGPSASGGYNGYLYIVKINSNGNLLWDKIFNGEAWVEADSIQVTKDGGYILAGSSWLIGKSYSDALITMLDSNGNLVWQKTYGGPGDDHSFSIIQTSDEDYVFAGITEPNGPGSVSRNFYLMKIDNQGNKIFERSFGDGRNDQCRSMDLCFDGGYILGGVSYDSDDYTNTGDIYVIKTDADGNVK